VLNDDNRVQQDINEKVSAVKRAAAAAAAKYVKVTVIETVQHFNTASVMAPYSSNSTDDNNW